MIDLEHVSKEYKRGGPLALDDINLHVDDGEFVFLLGHSGAGKSTLLKLLLREVCGLTSTGKTAGNSSKRSPVRTKQSKAGFRIILFTRIDGG